MKQIPTTNERVGDPSIDRLLRHEIGRRSQEPPACAAFDPDLAGAYAERALTVAETARYETHLTECTYCRRAVTVLLSTAVPGKVVAPVPAVATDARRGAGAFFERVFGALLTPQWGLAAAAVIVLAIALPIILSSNRQDRLAAEQALPKATAGESEPTSSPAQAVPSEQSRGDQPLLARARRESQEGAPVPGGVASGYAAPVTGPASSPPPVDKAADAAAAPAEPTPTRAEPPAKKESSSEPEAERQKREQVASGSAAARDAGQQPTQTPAATEQLAKVDERQAQRLPQGERDSARVTVLKQGRGDLDQNETKDAKIRPEDAVPPAAPGASVGTRARQSLGRSAPKLAMTDSSRAAEAAKANKSLPEKKLNSKRFWLRDDVWTDKDYNPLKQMPVVTIVRDSEVYREVLNKRSGLKPYFMLFSEDDRAIIVYKGTVYKLIPQNGSK